MSPRHLLVLLGLLTSVSPGASVEGEREPASDESSSCHEDPPDCDGMGISHLPLRKTSHFHLSGWWSLTLDPSKDDLRPHVSSKTSSLDSQVFLTRVSECRIRVVFQNHTASDLEMTLEKVEVWITVASGVIKGICIEDASYHSTSLESHIVGLAQSVVSSSLNLKPFKDSQNDVITESDHFGECPTHYHTETMDPGHHILKRTRDLTQCVTDGGWRLRSKSLSYLTNNAKWECQHQYQIRKGTDRAAEGEEERNIEMPLLSKIVCYQSIDLPGTANFSASLNMTFTDIQPFEVDGRRVQVTLRPMDSRTDDVLLSQEGVPLPKVRQILQELCMSTDQAFTPKAVLVYSQLMKEMKMLGKDALARLYREIFSGSLCSQHQKLKSLYASALRDTATADAAAAKCQLMAYKTAGFSRLWISSLASVQEPTTETLQGCARLLDREHWADAVLGVAALAGKAARNSCWGPRPYQCNFENPGCPQGNLKGCEIGKALQTIFKNLASHLPNCLSRGSPQNSQLLLAIRGLGNIGIYGHDIERSLMTCGGESEDYTVRLASIATLRRGSCNLQVTNWLKWQALNESQESELRITAFQSLYHCYPVEAEAVALLIMEKEADTQVKSYVSAYITNEEKQEDVRQFSRHFRTNLSSIFGLPDTVLETDLIFQNSFLPRSISFNLSSELLKNHGESIQLGGRIENAEEVLQSIFGHDGSARNSFLNWITILLQKAQEIFKSASEDFIQEHEREKRSYGIADIKNFLHKVKKDVITDLKGWVFAGTGGFDQYFTTFNVNPFSINWEEYLDEWLETLLESSYSSLINSDVEVTDSMTNTEKTVSSWSILGFPISFYKQEGLLYNAGASSRINLLSLLRNPFASAVDIGVMASAGTYSVSSVSFTSLSGRVTAEYSGAMTKAFDVSANLKVQGGDSAELKIDIPQDSFQGEASQTMLHLHVYSPSSEREESIDSAVRENINNFMNIESGCTPSGAGRDSMAEDAVHRSEISDQPLSKRHCKSYFENAFGLSAYQDTLLVKGKNEVILQKKSYIKKAEDAITGYKIGFSAKNPGINSLFLDIYMEAEGASTEQRMGLVFGLTYSPHFTIKILLHSQQVTASAELILVNDPNLKRLEGHLIFGKNEYGLKAELLMVEDGGQVSVKPRLVISYPGKQEDALLEGYVSRYLSDKVSSVSVDLYTEGTLKEYLDVALKGTGEYRAPQGREKTLTFKNVHLATPHFSLGLESSFSFTEDSVKAKVQATWGGQVMVLDGSFSGLNSGLGDQHYEFNFQLLFPERPHIDTRITCITQVYASEVTNNVTFTLGEGDTQRQFQAFHSTYWSIINPPAPTPPSIESSTLVEETGLLGPAARIANKLLVTSVAAGINWNIDHILQLTNKSVENVVIAQIGDEDYKMLSNFYDQSEELFKYHMELEISLPAWHFSYVDTLEKRADGAMVGRSTTVMPSGRIYSSSSRMYKSTLNGRILFEMSYDVLIRDGGNVWKIILQESFDWSSEHFRLQASADVANVTVFGLELAMDGIVSGDFVFHFKNWVKDIYEGEITLNNEGRNTEFNFYVIIVPFNREIKSKIALGHDGCSIGLLDGELSWDARRDASSTVTLSSSIQLPKDGHPLQLKGSMSVLHWTWKTELICTLGKEVGDDHSLMYYLILPDESKFQIGSQLGFSVGEKEVELFTTFEVQMPNKDIHNMSLAVEGRVLEDFVVEGALVFDLRSPITEKVDFSIRVKTTKHNTVKKSDVILKTHSEANYWEPIEIVALGEWDGSKASVVLKGTWGITNMSINSSATYWQVDDTHHIAGSAEVGLPLRKSWKQVKASVEGSFSVGQNPGRLKITHSVKVEKDFVEVFITEGEVAVHVPNVEGHLLISHAGSTARHHTYDLVGTFTGKELEIDIGGLVDGVPVKLSLHYIDGQEVTIKAFYKEESYFSISVKTQLKDVSIGIRKAKGTSFTLTTDGRLVYDGHRSQLHHELYISPSQASSVLRLSPILGQIFELTTSRTKYEKNHWGTVISLDWGERKFTYHDDVYFPGFSEWNIKIELDAPDFNITKATAEVEVLADNPDGEQAIKFRYLVHNDTLHSARLMYYTHGSDEEIVWRAGVSDVVFSAKEYSDLSISHAITLPVGGMEIKSNMTVGMIPIVGIGVTVTSHTRALLLSVCTTSEKCVRLRAHAFAQSTPSTRTYSVAAHALNSLFWKTAEDALVQNSLTFTAQETLDKVVVTGGIRRVECDHVICDNFVVRGVLHATLQITEDDLELLLDTTNRTMKLKSIVRQSQSSEIAPASLPGGRLISASTLEMHIWMNMKEDPDGVVNWNSTIVRYASSRASEWVVGSGIYHQSFRKILKLGGQLTAEPTSARVLCYADIFSDEQDTLKFSVEILQDRGNHLIIANFTKAAETQPRLMDVVVSFLPSPDSGEVSVDLIIPTSNGKSSHSDPHGGHSETTYSDIHFTLTCGLDSPHKYTAVGCRLTSPSVDEKVYIRYQLVQDEGCSGFSTSLHLLHHNYNVLQKSCRNPNSFQASISTKADRVKEKELAIKLGVLDTQNAELDLLDTIHIKFALHPPFLLHAMSHSSGDIWSRWKDFKENVKIELSDLFGNLRSVAVALAFDLSSVQSLERVIAPSPIHHLANYSKVQSHLLLRELEGDELIREISQNAQICIDVTSILLEAGIAYLNHNYGKLFMDLGVKIISWTNVSVQYVGEFFVNSVVTMQDAFTSSLSYLASLPQRALVYASTVPSVADSIQWIALQVSKVQESYGYALLSELLSKIVKYINWGMSLMYPSNEDLFSGEFISNAWSLWVPLPECSHSLLDVWNVFSGTERTSRHKFTLPAVVMRWWHLITNPSALFDIIFPPFPAYGAIIGDSNFISLDGRTFSVNTSCSHILLTDARDKLFSLISDLTDDQLKRTYTIFLGETIIKIHADYKVTINDAVVSLPYSSDTVTITRDLQHLNVATFDHLKRDLISLVCWTNHRACVVTVSGWLHADTRGLLGHFNLDPADDLMRPSGQMALSGDVFSHSWQIGSLCPSERTTMEIPSSIRARHLCKKFFTDFSSPTFPCQDAIDIRPYYETCMRYLSLEDDIEDNSEGVGVRSVPQEPSENGTEPFSASWNEDDTTNDTAEANTNLDNYSSLSLHISFKDLIFPFSNAETDIVDATSEDLNSICNIMSAYFTTCKAKEMDIKLPPICGPAGKLTFNEPVTPDSKQVDVVLLIDESSCDTFMYDNLIRPIPEVLDRIAHGKNISDVKMAAIGYGSGGGDVIYHIPGSSLLASASQLKLSQPHNSEQSRGTLRQSLRAVSHFPFRPGSVRVALVLRCSNQDIPPFTETLPKEMVRRRLVLFTLTPDLLVFSPTRPKAVRNTVGVDRWRVYSLRHDKQKSADSWGVRKPNSNVAQLAMKSGGGVFTVTPFRDEPRAKYYMKLFKKVLSRAIMKTVNNIYNKSIKTTTSSKPH